MALFAMIFHLLAWAPKQLEATAQHCAEPWRAFCSLIWAQAWCRSRRANMQHPGEQVTELLEKSSVSALVARWRARSASANPVPFGAQPVVENAERRGLAKKGFGKSKAPGLWAPVGVTLTFAAIVLQSLPK
ncbi:unnamed protein product [Effrenium voratum]|nr:unnamed protein product [Effrenium voratum]